MQSRGKVSRAVCHVGCCVGPPQWQDRGWGSRGPRGVEPRALAHKPREALAPGDAIPLYSVCSSQIMGKSLCKQEPPGTVPPHVLVATE